jgi:hypothetical protein
MRFGVCLMNHFDNELEIRQILLRESLEIRKIKTSPKNPKANGQIEHFNRSLLAKCQQHKKPSLLDISQERNCLILTRGPDKLSQRNLSTNTSMITSLIRSGDDNSGRTSFTGFNTSECNKDTNIL